MNNNSFKVLSFLIKSPMKWYDTQTIAYGTNLTNRQVLSTINMLSVPYVEKSRDEDKKLIIMFNGDENAIRETRRKMVIEHYHISEEDMDVIFRTLSSAGWLTMTDLIEETGHTKSTLGRALAVMDNVVSVNSGTSMLYRRVRTL